MFHNLFILNNFTKTTQKKEMRYPPHQTEKKLKISFWIQAACLFLIVALIMIFIKIASLENKYERIIQDQTNFVPWQEFADSVHLIVENKLE